MTSSESDESFLEVSVFYNYSFCLLETKVNHVLKINVAVARRAKYKSEKNKIGN